MSSMFFAERDGSLLATWETAQQVYWTRIERDSLLTSAPIAPVGEGDHRKHPVLAQDGTGRTLLAWISAGGWGKPGILSWQAFDSEGRPTGERGSGKTVPPWSMASVFARPDGGFVLLY